MLEDSKKTIGEQLNSDISKGVSMNGKVNDLTVKELFLGSKYLIIRTNFKGDLKLKIE